MPQILAPTNWSGVVTNVGKALLNTYDQGGHTLTITGATVGSGYVADIDLRNQTSVTEEKADASIVSTKDVSGGTKFKIQVGPASESVRSYTAHQIGVWAKLDDGEETLLILFQDAEVGVVVPVYREFSFALFATLSVGNTANLTVTIDETAYVTVSTLNEAVGALDDKVEAIRPVYEYVLLMDPKMTTAGTGGWHRPGTTWTDKGWRVKDKTFTAPDDAWAIVAVVYGVTSKSAILKMWFSENGMNSVCHDIEAETYDDDRILFTTPYPPDGIIYVNMLIAK